MDLLEFGWGVVDWIDLKSCCEFGIELLGSIKCWEAVECPSNWGSLE
jgi:hypothetical protein